MAFEVTAVNQILEGIVGTLGKGIVPEGQALTLWLQAMKASVGYTAKFIENDFILDIFADLDDSEETIQAAETWLLGGICRSTDDSAQIVQIWDVATPTPATNQGAAGTALTLEAGAATAPAAAGIVFFPYNHFLTTCLVSSVDHADFATGPGANTVRGWFVRRDQ
jgi:hypothetical protein